MQPGWVTTLTRAGRRVIALDNRGHGAVDQALRSGRLSHRHDGGRRARAARSSRPRARRRHGLLDGRAHQRAFSRSASGAGALGGAGRGRHQSDRGRGLAGERRGGARGAVDRRRDRSARPAFRAVRRADQVRSPGAGGLPARLAAGADARGGGVDPTPALVAVGTKDDIVGSPQELAALIPGASALDIPNRDHMLAVGDKVYKAGVLEFLEERHDAPVSPPPRCSPAPPATRSSPTSTARPAPPVLLLHGGGQTRHAWRKTAELIARMGRVAYAVDQRGHGDSEWVADGAYRFRRFRRRRPRAGRHLGGAQRQAAGRGRRLARRHGVRCSPKAQPSAASGTLFSALVLVDITPRVDHRGRRQDPGLHARAAPRRLRHDRRSRRRGRGLSAASAAAALARRTEEEPAPASGRPLALALGPALARRRPPYRRRLIARSSRR